MQKHKFLSRVIETRVMRWILALMLSATTLNAVLLFAMDVGKARDRNSSVRAESRDVTTAKSDVAAQIRLSEAYGKLPLYFEANYGQTDARVKFLSRGSGHTLFLTPSEAVFVLRRGDAATWRRGDLSLLNSKPETRKAKREAVLRMKLVGANPHARITGLEELPGKANYFVGNDPKKWHTDVPTFEKVQYEDIFPGIDLIYHGKQGQLEFDFVVHPGSDPSRIVLGFTGAHKLELDTQGDLVLHTASGPICQRRPFIYQEVDGVRREISGGYAVEDKRHVSFQVTAYDASSPLIIDPVLFYSTYLGGGGSDSGVGIAVDAAGNAYVTGATQSTDFPKTAGAFQTAFAGGYDDVFVSKLNPTGSGLVYSTYVGGNGLDEGSGIAVDAAGNAYITGSTQSTNFPTTPGAFQGTFGGFQDAFVTKLNPTGSVLLYSTYLGRTAAEGGTGIAVDSTGSAYLTGITSQAGDFPTTPGAFQTTYGGNPADAFVTKLNPLGTSLVYSTFLGGNGSEGGTSIALDAAGAAYVTGFTQSSNFPTTLGSLQTAPAGGADAFVTKLNQLGTNLVYSTLLGGTGDDVGEGIAVDNTGDTYVTGYTGSSNFPTTSTAFQTAFGGVRDAFVAKLNANGSLLLYSTYLGGSGDDGTSNIAIDPLGNAYVTGNTSSANFPTANAVQATIGGGYDAFVTKLNPAGSGLVYSTFVGGTANDFGSGIALDYLPTPNAYVVGSTQSTDFPRTPGAFQTTFGGAMDAFVAKISELGPPATLTLTPATAINTVGQEHCVTATVKDAFGNPTPNVTIIFSVSGANTASGSKTTDANGQATFCYTGTKAGVDTIKAFADTNNNGTQDIGEPSGTATKTYVPGAPATLTLTPATAINTVGQEHCVTATVKDAFGNPTPNVSVVFTVVGAQATFSTPSNGTSTTNSAGQTTFCFTASLPGDNIIHAFADSNNSGTQDAGEPFGDANKTWTPPANTQLCEVTITDGGWIIANNGDRANFGGNAKVLSDNTVQGQQQYQDQGPVQPLNVHSIQLTATTCNGARTAASIFGRATIDGAGSHVFRIDVTNMSKLGSTDSYGIMLDTGYMSGQHALGGGQVTIH